jgi:hypothetical protein
MRFKENRFIRTKELRSGYCYRSYDIYDTEPDSYYFTVHRAMPNLHYLDSPIIRKRWFEQYGRDFGFRYEI